MAVTFQFNEHLKNDPRTLSKMKSSEDFFPQCHFMLCDHKTMVSYSVTTYM